MRAIILPKNEKEEFIQLLNDYEFTEHEVDKNSNSLNLDLANIIKLVTEIGVPASAISVSIWQLFNVLIKYMEGRNVPTQIEIGGNKLVLPPHLSSEEKKMLIEKVIEKSSDNVQKEE